MSTSLDADTLVGEARLTTGLENFGPAFILDGLGPLLETYDRHVIDANGRGRCRARILGLLNTRLKIQAAFERHPEILEQTISRPMMLTGLPRSGTSALFNLLDMDPDTRALLQWETHCPEPLEGLQPGQPDPRRAAIAEQMEAHRNPEFDKIHFSSADTPEECVLLHSLSFDGAQLGFEVLLEPYASWFRQHKLENLYNDYRDLLKLLQWQRPGHRWLLKTPAHLWAVDVIDRVFPDVCLVWNHRDPLQVVPSITSLTEMVMGMYMGDISHIERHELANSVMEYYAASLERGLESRRSLVSGAVADVGYLNLVQDPLDAVRQIYRHFGLELDAAAEETLCAHIASNPKDKRGRHEYGLEQYGLSAQQVNSRFAFYLDDPVLGELANRAQQA